MSSCEFSALAVHRAGGVVEDFSYTARALQDDEVEVRIMCCGVCHSDVHQRHNDWGGANYPIVLGHEIVGTVTAVGSSVSTLNIGQRVGIGPQTGSCRECRECKHGEDQLCGKKTKSYNSATGDPIQPYTYGGFADRIRVKSAWAIPIPDGLDSVNAAPLLCAGETTWTPLVRHGCKIGSRVGIAGVGGLGHVAIQFAHHLGAEVTALSHSVNKKDEALSLGATHFINVNDADAMAKAKNSLDLIVSTISAEVALEPYLSLIRPLGTLCLVGLPTKLSFDPHLLVVKSLNFAGSYLASPEEITQMLKFAAQHNVQARTETLSMNAENATLALDRVERNEPRYRIVLTRDQQ